MISLFCCISDCFNGRNNQRAEAVLILSDNNCRTYIRRFRKLCFNRERLNVFTAFQNDCIFLTPLNHKLAIPGLHCKVTGVEPAFLVHYLGCQIWLFIIAFHYVFALNVKNAFLSRLNRLSFRIKNLNLIVWKCLTDCSHYRRKAFSGSYYRGSFCKAVCFNNADSDGIVKAVKKWRKAAAA